MGWWKADQPAQPLPASTPSPSQPYTPPAAQTPEACPVDPKTRSIWLQHAQSISQRTPPPPSQPTITPPQQSGGKISAFRPTQECSSDRIDQFLPDKSSNQPPSSSSSSSDKPSGFRALSHDRVISSIPRATPSLPQSASNGSTPLPANSEIETGIHSSGNWIYPSESQFFAAVMRKQSAASPRELASSISSIIPIHNAVNERAWHLIKLWEEPYNTSTTVQNSESPQKSSSAPCTGPKLLSFNGLGAGALSPKARLKSFMGYTTPFDRHDWVVERCDGKQVEYVIDFYQGKAPEEGKGREGQLNFYLDVRPKLNSLEGCRMRVERAAGLT